MCCALCVVCALCSVPPAPPSAPRGSQDTDLRAVSGCWSLHARFTWCTYTVYAHDTVTETSHDKRPQHRSVQYTVARERADCACRTATLLAGAPSMAAGALKREAVGACVSIAWQAGHVVCVHGLTGSGASLHAMGVQGALPMLLCRVRNAKLAAKFACEAKCENDPGHFAAKSRTLPCS